MSQIIEQRAGFMIGMLHKAKVYKPDLVEIMWDAGLNAGVFSWDDFEHWQLQNARTTSLVDQWRAERTYDGKGT